MLAGWGRYAVAEREAGRIAAAYSTLPMLAAPAVRLGQVHPLRSKRRLVIDVDQPVPRVLPGPDDAVLVEVAVTRSSRPIGVVTIVSAGRPVSRPSASTAIAGTLASSLVDVEAFRQCLERALTGARA